ncbi:hypothetical protein AJ79_04578 [Helicocarpus griseus UAMH5409]|uniref:Uncharacterized protein n=1 Tax=Helicocarpus griseus UAMH5409 TaxID=1447875 RepID=A0A2B7XT97_9EURO|nr:hypothetical protein AJ79_04578 [Helicocarpus griseus UAMH5409]
MERETGADGGSEDVNDFLARVRELGNKRDKEDEERTRKLEEEILQGRRERQARRAERARSISPTKDSPGPFDTSSIAGSVSQSSPTRGQSIEPPLTLLPSPKKDEPNTTSTSEVMKDSDTTKTDDLARHAARSSTTSRPSSRPLSWKQRPSSRDNDANAVPFPNLSSPKTTVEARPESTSTPDADSTPSRSHIAQSLASKDPTWFRQTADRGVGSPAYKRAQDNAASDVTTMSGNTRLPGFSKESTMDSDRSTNNDQDSERSRSPSRASSTYGTSSLGNRFSSVSSVSTGGGLGSPVPLSSTQRLESRASNDPQSTDRFAMSPSQNRLGSDRPSSPTKGLGGFVQSAMMKRSDSVSKRWSAQSTGRGSISKTGPQTPTSLSREMSDVASDRPNSRPGSSHSEATVVRQPAKGEFEPSKSANDSFARPLPTRPLSRSDSISNAGDRTPDVPTSPSKTMDPRRWSPTKATWLESALNKPDSPKLKSQTQQEPEWKKGLKLRQNKASVDLGRPDSPKFPVQKENQPPQGSRGISPQSPKETGKQGQISPTRSDLPKMGSAREPGNAGLRIETPATKPQAPEKSEKLGDLKSGSISSPRGSSESPASSPVGSQKGRGSLDKPGEGISPKPKTSTPALTDFRANLRRREIPNENTNKDEPEFKNVFGKLRRAETKNYVAPDPLKDNILRGKAGLNTTGGPKKTERVDEFKDSILKQKEAMKSGGGSIRRPTIERKGPSSPDKPEPEIPEAIARRRNMTRSGSIVSDVSKISIPSKPAEQPKSISPSRETRPAASNVDKTESTSPPTDSTPEPRIPTTKSSSTKSPELSKIGIAKPSRDSSSEDIADSSAKIDPPSRQSATAQLHNDRGSADLGSKASGLPSMPARSSFTKAPLGGQRERAGTGKLAERLNPALAGMLSRGPPTNNNNGPSGASNHASPPSMTSRTVQSEPSEPAKLTHTTKSRARGPKRRLPQSAKADTPQRKEDSSNPPKIASIWPLPDTKPTGNSFSPKPSPTKEKVITLPKQLPSEKRQSDMPESPATPDDQKLSKEKPAVSTKSPELRKFTPTSNVAQSDDSKPDKPGLQLKSLPSKKIVDAELSPPTPVARGSTSNESIRSERRPSPPPKPAAISPLPSPLQQKDLPPFPPKRITSPPVPPKPSSPVLNRQSSSLASKASPFPESSEAVNVFSSFFDAMPKASDKVEIDPQAALMSKSDAYPKINTISKQIWEITGDGKRKDLPANQGYILFEQSMYLCVHVFEVSGGSKTTQVNLWCGDEVGEAAIEDAQLFARKVARDNSCKLELVRQGKEAPSLIQALGSIIITRRGSSSRSNSSAMYMLRGRRHMGQVAFDEVELAAKSLCSGYPYLISAKFGKLYLWQGRGSTADELGCARLIGMDLGLTGEIEEVIEGKEPPGFFDTFPDTFDRTPAQTADYWKLKPTNGKYSCRLYRVDHELGQKGSGFWSRRGTSSPVTRPNDVVQEIEPFSQRDLDPARIHILDTFFEIFVIVGDRANERSADFASAMIFAQEYSIMAVSLQDRPFLPKCSVVMYGLSDECKLAFRKWDDRAVVTLRKTPTVIPLNAAIEAIR